MICCSSAAVASAATPRKSTRSTSSSSCAQQGPVSHELTAAASPSGSQSNRRDKRIRRGVRRLLRQVRHMLVRRTPSTAPTTSGNLGNVISQNNDESPIPTGDHQCRPGVGLVREASSESQVSLRAPSVLNHSREDRLPAPAALGDCENASAQRACTSAGVHNALMTPAVVHCVKNPPSPKTITHMDSGATSRMYPDLSDDEEPGHKAKFVRKKTTGLPTITSTHSNAILSCQLSSGRKVRRFRPVDEPKFYFISTMGNYGGACLLMRHYPKELGCCFEEREQSSGSSHWQTKGCMGKSDFSRSSRLAVLHDDNFGEVELPIGGNSMDGEDSDDEFDF